jgi:hypothetical protein
MREQKRRARRAVLIGVGLFVLCQAALLAVLQDGRGPLCDPDFGHKMRLLRRRVAPEGGDRPLCVVQLGTSRTAFGLRGRAAEPWLAGRLGRPVVLFNMGFHGRGPVTNRINLERLVHGVTRPDLVLLEVLPIHLDERWLVEEMGPVRRPTAGLSHAEMRLLARLAGEQRPGLEQEWWLAHLVPWSTYRLSLLSATVATLLRYDMRFDGYTGADESGWIPLAHQDANSTRRALARARSEYEGFLRDFRLSPRLLRVVHDSLERCREEGIAAGLVLMPEGPFFQSMYHPAARRILDTALAELCRECGADLIDLRDGWGEDDFMDSHHLYPEGASRFALRLAERVEALLRHRASSPVRSGGVAVDCR